MHTPSDIRTYQARQRLYRGPRGPWFEHLVEDCGCTMEEAADFLSGYELIPISNDKGDHLATLLKKNKEIHLAIFRKYRRRGQISADRIRRHLQPLLDKECFLVTKIEKGEDPSLLERLGFEPMGATIDGSIRTYILNEIRYCHAHHRTRH